MTHTEKLAYCAILKNPNGLTFPDILKEVSLDVSVFWVGEQLRNLCEKGLICKTKEENEYGMIVDIFRPCLTNLSKA